MPIQANLQEFRPATPAVAACAVCGVVTDARVLAEARAWRFWERADGACPACVQETLLRTLLERGEEALHSAIQTVWPLDADAAFGALPTPLRLHADPRYHGRCTTIAFVDSGFHPHPDLVRPTNRIRAWVDAGTTGIRPIHFSPDETPSWPDWDAASDHQWHGTMTSVAAAGNGYLSHGLYRGLASEADVVLVTARQPDGRITNESIDRALRWLLDHAEGLGVRVVNLSVAGDAVEPLATNPVDASIAELAARGIVVTAAAGNAGERRLVPPATALDAITVGGLDDANSFSHDEVRLWHSNYGESAMGAAKPELVAPSIWLAAPVLPGSAVAMEAGSLFSRRMNGDRSNDTRIDQLRLITPHYQHVDGTSFASPIVASAVACMLEANPGLRPVEVRELLVRSATRVRGAPAERQGAGALEAGRAVAHAAHGPRGDIPVSPVMGADGVRFILRDHAARRVRVFGSWDAWSNPVSARVDDQGLWTTPPLRLGPGIHAYKFAIDDGGWIDDPLNAHKAPDGFGGLNSILTLP
jgi:serine protease AprX